LVVHCIHRIALVIVIVKNMTELRHHPPAGLRL
jgi:hypothetical protein